MIESPQGPLHSRPPWLAPAERAAAAVILAAITWVVVTWAQNPFREGWFSGSIPVSLTNLPGGLVNVGDTQTVRVEIRADQQAWSSVQPSAFQAWVDLGGDTPGTYTEDVHVKTSAAYQVLDWQPRQITVHLEPLARRTLPVELDLTGALPDGYVLAARSVTPDQVEISGAQDLVDSVVRVSVATTLDGVHGDVTESLKPSLASSGGPVADGLQLRPATVLVALNVNRQVASKTVPLTVSTTGQVAPGYALTGVSVSPATVTINGSSSALNGVDAIRLPALSVNGATGDLVKTVSIPPNDTYSLATATEAQIRIAIAPIRASTSFSLGVSVNGVPKGMTASLAPAAVQVTLAGPASVLGSAGGQVSASVDASGLLAGSHSLPVKVAAPSGLQASAVPDSVTVSLQPAAQPGPSAASTTAASPSATAASSATPQTTPTPR